MIVSGVMVVYCQMYDIVKCDGVGWGELVMSAVVMLVANGEEEGVDTCGGHGDCVIYGKRRGWKR